MTAVAPSLDRIAIGIDLGAPSREALAWVGRELAPDAELMLVHALGVAPGGLFQAPRPAPAEDVAREARAFVSERLRAMANEAGHPQARIEVRPGGPAPTIGEVAEGWGADLIVVGPHGGDRPPVGGLGSTAERLVRTSPIPVLLGQGMRPRPMRRLLVPVDDVDLTPAVLDWAAMLARRDGATVELTHVLDSRWLELHAPPRAAVRAGAVAVADESTEARATTAAQEWLAGLAGHLPGDVRVERTVSSGRPGDEVLATVLRSDADLVVMGRRGRGRVLPGVLGSTASRVLRGAGRPVLIVVDPADRILDDWGTDTDNSLSEG